MAIEESRAFPTPPTSQRKSSPVCDDNHRAPPTMLETSPLLDNGRINTSNHPNKRTDIQCYGYMLGAAIFFWIMNASAKQLGMVHGLAASEIGFIRSLVSLPACVLILLFVPDTTILGPKSIWLHGWLRGFFAFGALVCTFFTVSKIALGDAIVLSFTSPVWSIFLGFLILKEKIRYIDLLITALSLTGCVLVSHPEVMFKPLPPIGGEDLWRPIAIGIGLLGALCQSLSFITVRQVMLFANPHPMQLLLHLSIISLPLGFLFALIEGKPWILPSGWPAWLLIAAVAVGGVIGQVCLALGLGGHAGVAGANNIMYFQVVLAYLADIIIWHNFPNVDSTIGAVLVFCCGAIGFVSARWKKVLPVMKRPAPLISQQETSLNGENGHTAPVVIVRQDDDDE